MAQCQEIVLLQLALRFARPFQMNQWPGSGSETSSDGGQGWLEQCYICNSPAPYLAECRANCIRFRMAEPGRSRYAVCSACKEEQRVCVLCGNAPVDVYLDEYALSDVDDVYSDWSSVSSACSHCSTSCTGTSCVSILSAAWADAKCYLAGTSFFGSSGEKVKVDDLEPNDVLISHGGEPTRVVDIIRHPACDREGVRLVTERMRDSGSQFIVTIDHRIVIPSGDTQISIPAGHLRVGSFVFGAEGQQRLVEVDHIPRLDVDVYQVTFDPDLAMDTYYVGDTALLTKGRRPQQVANRRSGMSKNVRPEAAGAEVRRLGGGAADQFEEEHVQRAREAASAPVVGHTGPYSYDAYAVGGHRRNDHGRISPPHSSNQC